MAPITLQSRDGGYNSNLHHRAPPAAEPLTNAGSISSLAGSLGNRSITGNIVSSGMFSNTASTFVSGSYTNTGSFDISGGFVDLNSSSTFAQKSGSLTIGSAGSMTLCFQHLRNSAAPAPARTGGTIGGTVVLLQLHSQNIRHFRHRQFPHRPELHPVRKHWSQYVHTRPRQWIDRRCRSDHRSAHQQRRDHAAEPRRRLRIQSDRRHRHAHHQRRHQFPRRIARRRAYLPAQSSTPALSMARLVQSSPAASSTPAPSTSARARSF